MELSKESKSHPLSAFFRVLAHFTRVVGGLEPDCSFTAKKIKAEEALRRIFGSENVYALANYRDLHVILLDRWHFCTADWRPKQHDRDRLEEVGGTERWEASNKKQEVAAAC